MARYKVIQVPVDDALLKALDDISQKRQQSRSAVIREACATYLARLEEDEADRRYIQSYIDVPETEEERQWGELGLKMLAEVTAEDDWSDDWNAERE